MSEYGNKNYADSLLDAPDVGSASKTAVPDRLVQWERSISVCADRVAEGLRQKVSVVLLVLSAFYFFVTFLCASRKLFWFDELFTLYLSRLPDLPSLWSALKLGVDLNPPLLYLFTRFSDSLFGEGHVATRLPEILGFWVFCLCLFRFVSSRISALAGLISMLFPLVTTAYFYAFEARSYGIVLGFGGVGLLCWQAAIRSRRRVGWLTGFSLALLCATVTHTYAILLLAPFVFSEMVGWLFLKRFDWVVCVAIAFSLSGVLVSIPLWRAAKANIPSSAFPASAAMLASSYQSLLAPAVSVFSAVLILICVAKLIAPSAPRLMNRAGSFELREVAVVIGFLAMPLFSFLVAKLTGAPFLYRYSISAVIGFACLLGVVSAKRSTVGLGVLVVLIVLFGKNFLKYMQSVAFPEPTTGVALRTVEEEFAHKYAAMAALPNKSVPIALLDDLEFLPIIHYAPANIAPRLVYILRPDSDINGQGYIRLQQCCGGRGHVAKLAEFLAIHDAYIVYCNPRSLSRLKEFIGAGGDLRVESASDDSFLVSVTFKGRREGRASDH